MSSKTPPPLFRNSRAVAALGRGCPGQLVPFSSRTSCKAVVVGVEDDHAGPERLGQVLPAERAVEVLEGQTGGGRDVYEAEACGGRATACAGSLQPPRTTASAASTDMPASDRPYHCGSTRPFLTANSTSSAALCTSSVAHQVAAMHGDGVHAQAEQHGDLLVRFAVRDQLQDLLLACAQLRERIVVRGRRAVGALRLAQPAISALRNCPPAATARTARVRSVSIAFFRM